jgi:hypothetical protein
MLNTGKDNNMPKLYVCTSEPVAVSYTTAGGANGESLGGMGPILTSGTFAAPGAGNAIHMIYQGPTLGMEPNFSGVVNGTTIFYLVDNGPTLGRSWSAT